MSRSRVSDLRVQATVGQVAPIRGDRQVCGIAAASQLFDLNGRCSGAVRRRHVATTDPQAKAYHDAAVGHCRQCKQDQPSVTRTPCPDWPHPSCLAPTSRPSRSPKLPVPSRGRRPGRGPQRKRASGIFSKAAQEDPLEGSEGHRCRSLDSSGGFFLQNRVHRLDRRVPSERPASPKASRRARYRREKMSERSSTGVCPWTCSGDMYPAVPRTAARFGSSRMLSCRQARSPSPVSGPKLGQAEVQEFTRPAVVTKRFAGFRSRWTIPLS